MFSKLYEQQMSFQQSLISKGIYDDNIGRDEKLPADNPKLESYHIQQLVSEIGEVLDADKRWKSFRNNKVDLANKKEEIADCFIVLMNVAMFSGFTAEDVLSSIEEKIKVNNERIRMKYEE